MMIKSKQILRLVVCLLLSTCVLACSFSVFADDGDELTSEEFANQLETENMLYFIWATMRSWGIDIEIGELREFGDETSEVLWSWIQEYLADNPSISSFPTWIFPWKVFQDDWGIIRGNQNFLEDVQDFVDWLVVKFSLVSNTTEIIQQALPYVLDDSGNKYYAGAYDTAFIDIGTPLYICNKSITFPDTYIYFKNGEIRLVASNNGSSVNYILQKLDNNGVYQYYSGATYSYPSGVQEVVIRLFYWAGGTVGGVNREQGIYSQVGTRYRSDGSTYYASIYGWSYNFFVDGTDDGIAIVVGDLIVPDDTEIDGQSIQIDDGESIYLTIDWPESISVDNLPAIVSTEKMENPEIDQIYTNVPAFVETAGDSIGLMKQILFRMPDEVLIALYALLASGVIFGFLRIMREH